VEGTRKIKSGKSFIEFGEIHRYLALFSLFLRVFRPIRKRGVKIADARVRVKFDALE
jgi:hypothetical protein